MEIALIIICLIILIILLILNIMVITKQSKNTNVKDSSNEISTLGNELKNFISEQNRDNRVEINTTVNDSIRNMSDVLLRSQMSVNQTQSERLFEMEQRMESFSATSEERLNNIRETVETRLEYIQQDNNRRLVNMENKMENFSKTNEQKMSDIRETVEKRLEYIQNDNNQKLDKMREVVDEKLQKTLDEKMTRSFALVNERLEQVYKGLGEMQNLAVGVGDLKKVLSNVKTRGILGEIQLGAILKEILSPEQYEENVVTKKSTKNPVEFAVKLPNDNNSFVYLPIDSKFPADTYQALLTAQDTGNKEEIITATKRLVATIKSEAKDIHEKYIDPPQTTEFAIMFLPCEGLYAEAVNRGLVEILQREYKINIAGPSTMAALLNSLQMGFKTLAVQKRSAQVWEVLNSVKTEFDKFGSVLEATQQRLNQANSELDKLVGVRTRQIQRKLSKISSTDDISDNHLIE
ncbi:MAG: DNA recombination protein RmuC [Acutalibacteraceae bacterium]|nr:DNA recombination protein RmuC [Acutalibacteraceae bacterium]